MPAVASERMIATSHPLATRAGMRAFERGGNAVDAALAAAAVLTVAEPTDNGVGGDAFALVWHDGSLYGLNGSGRSPAVLDGGGVDDAGPRSVTVPGAVRLWADLAERFGRLGLDVAVGPAADLADSGLACTARIADKWAPSGARAVVSAGCRRDVLAAGARRHAAGDRRARAQLRSTRAPWRQRSPSSTWLSEDDLAAHRSEWVEPLRYGYRGVEVCELPPNGQGAAALLALALYDGLEPGLHSQLEAMKIALADTRAAVHDGPLPEDFFGREPSAARRALVRPDAAVDPAFDVPRGGTTYLCVVDGRRDGGFVDPERVRLVRLGRRRGGHRCRAAEPGGRLQRRLRRIRTRSRPPRGRFTRSSRACCSRTAACSGRSA